MVDVTFEVTFQSHDCFRSDIIRRGCVCIGRFPSAVNARERGNLYRSGCAAWRLILHVTLARTCTTSLISRRGTSRGIYIQLARPQCHGHGHGTSFSHLSVFLKKIERHHLPYLELRISHFTSCLQSAHTTHTRAFLSHILFDLSRVGA